MKKPEKKKEKRKRELETIKEKRKNIVEKLIGGFFFISSCLNTRNQNCEKSGVRAK